MTIGALISYILFKLLVPGLFVAATLAFLWGVMLHFVASSDGELSYGKGKALMLWGVLAFAFMVLVWWVLRALAGAIAG